MEGEYHLPRNIAETISTNARLEYGAKPFIHIVEHALSVDGGTLPPAPTPAPGAAEWASPADLTDDEVLLAELFGRRWECYRAWPHNEALLDELHNARERYAVASYFEIPTDPREVLQGWALPANLRGNVHLDEVRHYVVDTVLAAPLERNFVIIGEPGVGKTALLFELFDRLMARAPTALLTTTGLGDAHARFGVRLCYDDIPENPALVQTIAEREVQGLVITAREADWKGLPMDFQRQFDRLTVPLFDDVEMASVAEKILTFSGLGYDAPAVETLVSYAQGSPIYVWSLVRELVHHNRRTLSRAYLREHATRGMTNYVSLLLQRLLREGGGYRPGGRHALACLIFLAHHIDERQAHGLYFSTVAERLSPLTEKAFGDPLHRDTFNRVMAYLTAEGMQVRFPHDTWVDVLEGAGKLNPFRAELQHIESEFADSGLYGEVRCDAVGEAWQTMVARYRRDPTRHRDSFLAFADTLLRNFTLSDLDELDVDVALLREVASACSHLPLAAMLVSKIQAAQPTQVTRIINIQDSIISRSTLNLGDGDSETETDIRDSIVHGTRGIDSP